jgi:hypothetical protein
MDGILKNVQDPSWWFTACFVGAVVAVVGGLLVNRIERRLGAIWAWYGLRSATRRTRRRKPSQPLRLIHNFLRLRILAFSNV